MELRTGDQFILLKLRRSYVLAIGIIALLIGAKHYYSNYLLTQQSKDALTINFAGRQRMLSQRLAKQILVISYSADTKQKKSRYDSLLTTFETWKYYHKALKIGDPRTGMAPMRLSDTLIVLNAQLDIYQREMEQAISSFLAKKPLTAPLDSLSKEINTVLNVERNFLVLMDKITWQFTNESAADLQAIKEKESIMLWFVLFVLLAEAIFIFRPLDKAAERFLTMANHIREKLMLQNQELQATIEQQKQTEEELKASEEQLQKTLIFTEELNNNIKINSIGLQQAQSLAKLSSFMYDTATQELSWNEFAPVVFGYPKGTKPNDMPWEMLFHPDDKELAYKIWTESVQASTSYKTEYRVIGQDGQMRYIRTTADPQFDTHGNCIRIVGAIQDITSDFLIRNELEEAKKIAEEGALAKSQFLSTMSHEIRTPMNAVIGFTQLLLLENKQPELNQMLQTLEYSANHLLALINDILDYSKIESGKLEFEDTEFDLSKLCDNVLKIFQLKADEKKLELSFEPKSFVNNFMVGDTTRLTQILANLIGNAIKFTEKGFVFFSYQVVSEDDKSAKLRFSVADSGIGMRADKLSSIFESFTQVGADITRKYGGSGLGLAIVKRLVELQNGTIWVESEVSRGSTFYFELNFQKGKELPKILDRTVSRFVAPSVQSEEMSLKGVKVLVVEDNKINQMVAKKFLTRWQATVDLADNGLLGLLKVQQETFDVVLMDLQMPEMDGLTAARNIRAMGGRFENLPIIALTASASMEVKEEVKAMGMNDYIAKPFVADDLYNIIKRNL